MAKLSDKEKFLSSANLGEKHFGDGMYAFTSFLIAYYSRVKSLNLDFESFMILQVVLNAALYDKNQKSGRQNFFDIEKLWERDNQNPNKNKRLTAAGVCLIINLPKETVRRKILNLTKRKILVNDQKKGLIVGEAYKKIFSTFVPTTVIQVSRLLKSWRSSGSLEALLNLHTGDI